MGYFDEPKREMLCSMEYAEELLDISHEEGHDGEKWLDVILRYCNPSYQFFYKEEMKKANDLYCRLRWNTERNVCSIEPSYEVVCLKADETADARSIHKVDKPVIGYSVLTTGACFPGAKQCDQDFYLEYHYPEATWLADFELETSKWFFEDVIRPEQDVSDIVRAIKNRAYGYPDSRECINRKYISRDEYSFEEFVMASELDFLDNYPGAGGPRCPDRMTSGNAKENTYRMLLRDCVRLGLSLGKSPLNPVVYGVALETALIGKVEGSSYTFGMELSLDGIIDKADEYFEEILQHEQEEEKKKESYKPDIYRDELTLEDRLYLYLISDYEAGMKKTAPENEYERRVLVRHRDDAIKNKANAFSEYTHPAWDDELFYEDTEEASDKAEETREVLFDSWKEEMIREYLMYLVSQGKYDKETMDGYLEKILYGEDS